MNVEALNILLNGKTIGKLFRFANGTASPIVRFVADDAFSNELGQDTLSLSMLANEPAQQGALWRDIQSKVFNGSNGRLPPFFQCMLPEGAFLNHLAQERDCKPDDHFAVFAACGLDLPGAVKALPAHLNRTELSRLVTQENDALEMSVTADPLPLGVSISGMQPKVGLIKEGGRYVARKRLGVTRIIGKLPQADRPRLPELEDLSLRMAAAAGTKVCQHSLQPLDILDFEHGYTIGGSSKFLAIERFDRSQSKRIHCEVVCQALAVDPAQKYTGATYAAVAALMMRHPETLGVAAVHELLRLITVNEIIGNYDAHLQNFAFVYEDQHRPTLSPAYDIVAWSAYLNGNGHALAFYREDKDSTKKPPRNLSPEVLREFCNRVGVAETACSGIIRETAARAFETWPAMVESSEILSKQKQALLKRISEHPFASSYVKRRSVRKVE
jgi:serine/threonine-protein kinase HipA